MSKFKVALTKNRTFILWFASYLLVLLVPVTIYLTLYSSMTQTAKKEVERANSMMLSQFLQFQDNSLREVEAAASSIYNDTKIKSLMYKSKPLSPQSIYQIVDIQKDLRKFRLSNSNINNIYVYCKRSDMLISIGDTFRRMDTASFYKQLTDMKYGDWLSALEKTNLPTYQIFVQRSEPSQRGFDKLTYSRPFSFAYTENMAGMVIITFDVEQLKQKFFKSSYNATDQYYIIDNSGEVLALNQNLNFPANLDFSPLINSKDGIQQGLIDVPGYTCLSVKSQVNECTYVRFVDTADMNQRIATLRISFLVSISFSLILGTIIAFLLTKYNYNPLHNLKLLLGSSKGDSSAKMESDFQYIIRQVQNLQIEKDSIKREMELQLDVVQNAILMRIMTGELSGEELDKVCSVQGLKDCNLLAVILASLDDTINGCALSNEQQTILVKTLFAKVFNTVSLNGYVTEIVPGIVACLALINGDRCEADALDDIKSSINDSRMILAAARHSTTVTIAFSAIHNGISTAHTAYDEAHEALEYGWLTGLRHPLDYSSIKDKPGASGYIHQALQYDYHFINCIRALDFAGARHNLTEIIDTELSGGNYSVRMGRFRMYGLISMLIGAVGENENLFGNSFFDCQGYIQRLSTCRKVQELRSLVNEILDRMSLLYAEQKFSSEQNGIMDTKEFIERNYMDPNLSVAMLAGALNLPPSYLTQLFKRETGHNAMDYIHLTRLKAAKEYLKEYKIKDVARKVGFYDVRALIRVFRKYEGVTPGKFKKLGITQDIDESEQGIDSDCAV